MSYNGIGLPTPRGTGTSGYVQRNSSALNPATQAQRGVYSWRQELEQRTRRSEAGFQRDNYVERKVDQGILEHERKRAIEVECMALRDELEETDGIAEDEIERRVDELRARLKARADEDRELGTLSRSGGGQAAGTGASGGRTQFKSHQVHEIVRAKELENERFRLDVLSSSTRRAGLSRRSSSFNGSSAASGRSARYRDHRDRDRDRSLSPPTRHDDDDTASTYRNGRERSPSGDRSSHHHRRARRRSSVTAGSPPGRRQSWTSHKQQSRSRSPPASRYRDERDDGGVRGRRSSTSAQLWRDSIVRERDLSDSPGGSPERDSLGPLGRESSAGRERERPRSRSPHGSRQEARDLRRRGSRYGPGDVDLNYN